MAEQKPEEKKVELTFDQKLAADGWRAYYISHQITDLRNPDKTLGSFGFTDAHTQKQVIVTVSAAEWMRILTEFAKRQAGKA